MLNRTKRATTFDPEKKMRKKKKYGFQNDILAWFQSVNKGSNTLLG